MYGSPECWEQEYLFKGDDYITGSKSIFSGLYLLNMLKNLKVLLYAKVIVDTDMFRSV